MNLLVTKDKDSESKDLATLQEELQKQVQISLENLEELDVANKKIEALTIKIGEKTDREKALKVELQEKQEAFNELDEENKNLIRITLTEGKKHEIRRMLNALNLTIKSLKRVRFYL